MKFIVDILPPGAATIVSLMTVNALGDGFGDYLPVDSMSNAKITNSSVVPEPTTMVLLCTGIAGLTCSRMRRRK
ncbi:MAG: PEP-CTERM sorting domain-containing protein [Proteobacteria bacterium]|nr:PEP-CTERM sorting domain-containing protein [Pseudomonadota bacterium]